MNQREVIARFNRATRAEFNPEFFKRDEDEIIQELINVIRSCERDNEYFTIKLDSYRVVDDYDEVNSILYNYYESLSKNKPKSKKRDNQYECINLNESDIRLLIVRYYLRDKTAEDYLDVIICVPRVIDKYYFRINGIMRSTLFQIVDGSTYNNGTSNAKIPSITLKIIFMAMRVNRYYCNLKTTDGDDMKLTYYYSRIFNKSVPAAKYIFAKFGFYGALQFLLGDNSNIISVTKQDPNDQDLYTFNIGNFYINCPRFLLDRNLLLQSIISTIYNTIIPDMPFEVIFDNNFWIRSLGVDFSGGGAERLLAIINNDEDVPDTLEKGYSILDSFQSIYDISTRESIRLPDKDKETTYHILRWVMREFNALRVKDNLNIGCKKIRFAQYIASLYAFKIANGIYRISDSNKKATIASIKKAIRTDPNFLLVAITKSKMVSYRNMVSDMDSMQALKFTYKGVSGLGENSNQSIPDIYRSIHPSHLGKVDLDSSSDGNPGITGTICPYAKIYDGGFLEDYEEPNTWEQEFLAITEEYKKAKHMKQAFEFEQNILGVDRKEEITVASEIVASMQQIIKPVMFANEGEIIMFGDD